MKWYRVYISYEHDGERRDKEFERENNLFFIVYKQDRT